MLVVRPGKLLFAEFVHAVAAFLLLPGSLAAQTAASPAPAETREFRYLMGTSVQIAAMGGDVSAFVPASVAASLKTKFAS